MELFESQRREIDHTIASDKLLGQEQPLLQEQLLEQNRELREAHEKSLNEMEELKPATFAPIHMSTAEKSGRPEQNQDLRCQSGPSAKNSVIFSGGTLQRILGQTNNDCRFRISILTSSLRQQPLLAGR